MPIHAGSGPGLTPRNLGSKGGQENVTLTVQQMPAHNHTLRGTNDPVTRNTPEGNVMAKSRLSRNYAEGSADVSMNNSSIGNAGGGGSHTNIQPYLTLNYIIALEGFFPPRN